MLKKTYRNARDLHALLSIGFALYGMVRLVDDVFEAGCDKIIQWADED